MDDQLRDDLRSTAEAARAAAEELARVEARKAALDPADPEALTLAARAKELADSLREDTRVELLLVELAQDAGREDVPASGERG